MVKNMYLNPYPTQKWLKVDYRSKYIRKNYKNSEKTGENLSKHRVGTELLDRTQKSLTIKQKNLKPDKPDSTKS